MSKNWVCCRCIERVDRVLGSKASTRLVFLTVYFAMASTCESSVSSALPPPAACSSADATAIVSS